MRRWVRTLAMTSLLVASAAHAQSPTVKELFENGQLHFDGGQYELAVEAWQAAWEQSQRPILLVKMADAREAQGEVAAAIELLQTYREQAEEVEIEPLDERISSLEAQLVDTPEPQPADPEPEPVPAPTPAPMPAPTPSKAPVIVEGILIGITAGGLGIGTGYGMRARAARTEAMTFCVDGPRGLVCDGAATDALSRDKASSITADIGFVIGGVAGAAATVNGVFLSQRTSVRLSPTPLGFALHVTR